MEFTQAVHVIFELEGGYVNDPNDRGGETRWGISKKSFPNIDIKNLTQPEAANLYLTHYWMPMRCDELPLDIRLPAFDAAVNHGVATASKMLQKIVGTTEDGVVGPETISAIREYRGDLRIVFMAQRLSEYTSLNQFSRYGRGWVRRIAKVAMQDGKA